MKKLVKKDLIVAIDEINLLIEFETPIGNSTRSTVEELIAGIEAKQSGDEKFLGSDFGGEDGLSRETVETLIAAKVTVPKEWKGLLKKEAVEEVEEDEEDEEDFAGQDPDIDSANKSRNTPASQS